MHSTIRSAALAVFLVLAPLAVKAHNYTLGALRIDHPWSRPTPLGAPTAAGYLVITNTGPTPDRLLGGSSPLAASIEVHQMTMNNGVMRMRPVTNGLPLPPHATVKLEPGAYHLMIVGPRRTFRIGDHIPATLRLYRAGQVQVEFYVQSAPPAESQDRMNVMGGMNGMSH